VTDLPTDRFARLGRALVRRPRWVALAWLAIVVAAVPLAGRVGTVLDAQPRLGSDSEAVQVAEIEARRFPGGDAGATVVLLRAPEGAGAWSGLRDAAIERIEGLPGVARLLDLDDLDLEVGGDRTFLGRLSFDDADPDAAAATIDGIRELAQELTPIELDVAGGAATTRELQQVSDRDARRGEVFGLPLSLLVLLVAFGAVVASLLPLLVAAASVTVALAAVYLVGQLFPFAVYTQTIVTMLGLATGIDYALLLVNRFREEVRRGRSAEDAAIVTTATAGKAMVMSGLTVVLALVALLVPPLPYIRSAGVGTMIVLLVTMTVALTALPPLLAILGPRVDALRVTRRVPGLRTRRFWRRRAEAIMAAPYRWMVPGLLGLLALAAPALGMRVADPGVLGLARGTEARTVVQALDRSGLGGLLASVTVLVDTGEDGFFGVRAPRRVSQLTRSIEELDGVARVVSPFAAPGVPRLLLLQYYVDEELARGAEVAPVAAATIGSEGRWVRLQVIPSRDLDPAAAAALASDVRALAAEQGLPVRIGGTSAFEADWSRALYGAFPWALAVVVLATLALLGLGFRSILIPIKSVALNALTVAAAYGVVTLVFQYGVGARWFGLDGPIGFIDTNVPLFVFAIVFGLSMDYEVFLVSRIYENHRAGMDDARAVTEALVSTGNVISSAAAVMLAVFSVFLFSDVVLIKMLGLALFVAVLLDATVVRAMLVPAVMRLAGRANWWMPAPMARLADRVDLSHDG
jgi:RND superfamily putative drug exporter